MKQILIFLVFLLVLVTAIRSCSRKETGPPRIQTHPVSGKVTVDGATPGKDPKKDYELGIQIGCHAITSQDPNFPTNTQALVEPGTGTFQLSTYEAGDGVPEGEYQLTFSWQDYNVMTRSFAGPDKFKGRYNDPKKSQFKLVVKAGQPSKISTPEGELAEPFVIDLKTK